MSLVEVKLHDLVCLTVPAVLDVDRDDDGLPDADMLAVEPQTGIGEPRVRQTMPERIERT